MFRKNTCIRRLSPKFKVGRLPYLALLGASPLESAMAGSVRQCHAACGRWLRALGLGQAYLRQRNRLGDRRVAPRVSWGTSEATSPWSSAGLQPDGQVWVHQSTNARWDTICARGCFDRLEARDERTACARCGCPLCACCQCLATQCTKSG
jgi:hypothetical protein